VNISVNNYNIIHIPLIILTLKLKEGDKIIMTDNKNNNEIQNNNQRRSYFTDSQVITGNLATGEHRQVRRSTQ